MQASAASSKDRFRDLDRYLRRASSSSVAADPRVIDLRAVQGDCERLGLRRVGEGVFEFVRSPFRGLRVFVDAVSAEDQVRWSRVALAEFSGTRYTNLSNLGDEENLGARWRDAVRDLENQEAWKAIRKLRWVNLGVAYDWTKREYKPESLEESVPEALDAFLKPFSGFEPEEFHSDTAIVNFYHENSVMGPHVDEAEFDMSRPVVSMSLGASCIFLVGGPTKDIEPCPILLRSGDVICMAGESRWSFHGVARIFPLDETVERDMQLLDAWKASETNIDVDEKEAVLKFIKSSRINMNVRQIFPRNEKGERVLPQTE